MCPALLHFNSNILALPPFTPPIPALPPSTPLPPKYSPDPIPTFPPLSLCLFFYPFHFTPSLRFFLYLPSFPLPLTFSSTPMLFILCPSPYTSVYPYFIIYFLLPFHPSFSLTLILSLHFPLLLSFASCFTFFCPPCHTPTLAKCGGEAQHLEKLGVGVLRDSRMFRARQQGAKHLALECS